MSISKLAAVSAALLLALGLPLVAGAKEESKIQVLLALENSDGAGNGKAKGRSDGKMQSTFTETQATFQVHAKQLDPLGEYRLLARESDSILPENCDDLEDCPCQPVEECSPDGACDCNPEDGCLLIQDEVDPGSNGQVNLKIDLLQTGDETQGPIDPRGKLIAICQGTEAVMSAWFYGDAGYDTPHTKVKEQTELDPFDENAQGSVSARYTMGPNGKGSLNLQLQNVAPGTYQIYVDEAPLILDGETPVELVPNPGGIAKLSLSTQPGKGKASGKSKGKGKGKEHNKKGLLPSDLHPWGKLIEVIKFGETTPAFCGPMLAQIPNLNDGDLAAETVTSTEPDPEQMWVTTGVEEGCDRVFAVAVSGLPAGDYALCVDGNPVVDGDGVVVPLMVADDGQGELRFEEKPETDEPEELLLSFPVGSGSVIGVTQWDPDPMAVDCTTPVLSVTIP